MGFEQLKRHYRNTENTSIKRFDNIISVRFYRTPKVKNKYHTFIAIGKSICEKLGINSEGRIAFFCDTDNPRVWFIKKTIETDNDGYKISKGSTGRSLKFRISLPYVPQEFEKEIRHVRYDFYEGGLRIFSEESFDKDDGDD